MGAGLDRGDAKAPPDHALATPLLLMESRARGPHALKDAKRLAAVTTVLKWTLTVVAMS